MTWAFKALFCICLLYAPQTIQVDEGDRVMVLTYHHIDEGGTESSISLQRFSEHMKALRDNHYNVIPLDHFLAFLEGKASVPPRAVLITFDDGYESNYTKAYPIMKQYGFVGTIFIVVSSTEIPNPKNIPHVTWDQLTELQRDGWAIGSHTYNLHHTVLGKQGQKPALVTQAIHETATDYRLRVRKDLETSLDLLERRLGKSSFILAFPYGAYNDSVLRTGKDIGIHYFFTTREGSNQSGQTLLFRINAGSPQITSDMLLSKLHSYQK